MSETGDPHPTVDRCDPALIAVLRAQTPAQKLATLDGIWRSAVAFVRCGVRSQHPDWPEDRVAVEVARRMASQAGSGSQA